MLLLTSTYVGSLISVFFTLNHHLLYKILCLFPPPPSSNCPVVFNTCKFLRWCSLVKFLLWTALSLTSLQKPEIMWILCIFIKFRIFFHSSLSLYFLHFSPHHFSFFLTYSICFFPFLIIFYLFLCIYVSLCCNIHFFMASVHLSSYHFSFPFFFFLFPIHLLSYFYTALFNTSRPRGILILRDLSRQLSRRSISTSQFS